MSPDPLDYFRSDWTHVPEGTVVHCFLAWNPLSLWTERAPEVHHVPIVAYLEYLADFAAFAAKLNNISAPVTHRLVPRLCHGSTVAGEGLHDHQSEGAEYAL